MLPEAIVFARPVLDSEFARSHKHLSVELGDSGENVNDGVHMDNAVALIGA